MFPIIFLQKVLAGTCPVCRFERAVGIIHHGNLELGEFWYRLARRQNTTVDA
jgi:hypothetical protein